jgi:hypothetical protein
MACVAGLSPQCFDQGIGRARPPNQECLLLASYESDECILSAGQITLPQIEINPQFSLLGTDRQTVDNISGSPG